MRRKVEAWHIRMESGPSRISRSSPEEYRSGLSLIYQRCEDVLGLYIPQVYNLTAKRSLNHPP